MQRGLAAGAERPILQCCKGFSGFSQDCKKKRRPGGRRVIRQKVLLQARETKRASRVSTLTLTPDSR